MILKPLALSQDNEKNQIYLGHSNSLLALFPGKVQFRSNSSSTSKPGSDTRKMIIEHSFDFFWLRENGQPVKAPYAKIIDYFQYPEMRFSGFLRGCSDAPDALRREKQDEYGQRILVFGFANDRVFGAVVTEKDSQIVPELLRAELFAPKSVFRKLNLGIESAASINPKQLIQELESIGSVKQYESQILRKDIGAPEPFRGLQGAGWTMEALLGIPRNSSASPDKYGFEIKTYSGSQLTLMTPEPDSGHRYEHGLTSFLEKYGWAGTKSDGSLRFNGRHKVDRIYPKSGLSLHIENWNKETNSPTGNGSPNVLLINSANDEIAAGWSFEKLAERWAKKHAGAFYIPSHKYHQDQIKFPSHYSFGPEVLCGIGTNVVLFLKALNEGIVFLDPGDRVDFNGEEKKRTQWRISKQRGLTFSSTLAQLYDDVSTFKI